MAFGTSGLTPANRRACAAMRGAIRSLIHHRSATVPVVVLLVMMAIAPSRLPNSQLNQLRPLT